jgi:hypothetical protein
LPHTLVYDDSEVIETDRKARPHEGICTRNQPAESCAGKTCGARHLPLVERRAWRVTPTTTAENVARIRPTRVIALDTHARQLARTLRGPSEAGCDPARGSQQMPR